MKAKGVLYTVEGPRGVYYAIHDPATARVWTERTESAAVALARELDILLAAEEVITTDELLRRTSRDLPDRKPFVDNKPDVPLRSPESELDVAPPAIPGPAMGEPIVSSRLDVSGSCFAADLPIGTRSPDDPFQHLPPPPPIEGFHTWRGDVLDPTRREI